MLGDRSRFWLVVFEIETAFQTRACFSSSGVVVATNGRNEIRYSMWFNSGRRASSSASVTILRGCLGSRAMRVRPCPMPRRTPALPLRYAPGTIVAGGAGEKPGACLEGRLYAKTSQQ